MPEPWMATPVSPVSAPPGKVRCGRCITCGAPVTIEGRGKLPLRCPPCRRERRRESNRLSQRRFKAKARAERARLRPVQPPAPAPRVASHSPPPARGAPRVARPPSVGPRARLSSALRSSARQPPRSLHGEVAPGLVVRTEYEERAGAVVELLESLRRARERAFESRLLLDRLYFARSF